MSQQKLGSFLVGFAVLASAPTFSQQSAAMSGAPIRVGIVLPEAQLGQGNTGQDVSEPVRQLIISYMAGPKLELVTLQSRISAQVNTEAEQQNCAYVLYTSVEQKKAGKGMGSMLGMLGPAASMLPGIGGMAGSSGALIAGAATQAISAAAMQSAQQDAIASLTQAQAGSVKARDQIALTYQFVAVGGSTPLIKETLKAKAKQDGEDLLRPLVEQLAEKTVNAAVAPRG
jgi:hypothetical protein